MSETLTSHLEPTEQDVQEVLASLVRKMKKTHREIEKNQAETARIREGSAKIRYETDQRMEELKRFVAALDRKA